MLHASAFSLYLLACLAESVGYTLYVVAPHTFRQVYIWTAVFVALFSFVAQVLLCFIFWDLGYKIDDAST